MGENQQTCSIRMLNMDFPANYWIVSKLAILLLLPPLVFQATKNIGLATAWRLYL